MRANGSSTGCASTEVTPDQIMRPLGLLQGCGQALYLAKARTYGIYTNSFLVWERVLVYHAEMPFYCSKGGMEEKKKGKIKRRKIKYSKNKCRCEINKRKKSV